MWFEKAKEGKKETIEEGPYEEISLWTGKASMWEFKKVSVKSFQMECSST